MENKKTNYKKCKVKLVDKVYSGIEIRFTEIELEDKYNRAKKKAQDIKDIEMGYFKWEDERI